MHHATGNLGEAKLLYNEACHLWPQFPLAQYGMAQMLVSEGNIEPAVKALDAVLAEVPDNQVDYVVLRLQHMNHSIHFLIDATVALDRRGGMDFFSPHLWLTKTVPFPPSTLSWLAVLFSQEALVLLGVLYAKHKQRLPALSKFKRALELNPDMSDAWIAQAQVSVRTTYLPAVPRARPIL